MNLKNVTFKELIDELESEEDFEISWWTGAGEGGFDMDEDEEESDILHLLQNIIMEGLDDNKISSHTVASGVFQYDSSNKSLYCEVEFGDYQEEGPIPPGQTKEVRLDLRTYYDRLTK
jgi:hypothetical protein